MRCCQHIVTFTLHIRSIYIAHILCRSVHAVHKLCRSIRIIVSKISNCFSATFEVHQSFPRRLDTHQLQPPRFGYLFEPTQQFHRTFHKFGFREEGHQAEEKIRNFAFLQVKHSTTQEVEEAIVIQVRRTYPLKLTTNKWSRCCYISGKNQINICRQILIPKHPLR